MGIGLAAGIGAGLASIGIGGGLASMGIKGTSPGRQLYGGSQQQYDALQQQYGGQVAGGQKMLNQGVYDAGIVGAQGSGLMSLGQGYQQQSNGSYAQALDAASQIGDPYSQLGDMGAGYMTAASDANARQQMAQAASARGGNQASAMRSAGATGAQNALQAGQQAAQLSMQGRFAQAQGLSSAQAQQAQMTFGVGQQQQAAGLNYGQMGLGAKQYSADAQMGAGSGLMNLGQNSQLTMNGQQLDADTQIAMARAQAQQQKRAGLMGLFGGLTGAGGGVMASAVGK